MDGIISKKWHTQGLQTGNYYVSLGYELAYFYVAQGITENPVIAHRELHVWLILVLANKMLYFTTYFYALHTSEY